MRKKRDPDATPISTGYVIDLYCCVCKKTGDGHEPLQTIIADGPNAYADARKKARKMGWVLHNDGYATCPKCK